MRPDVRCYLQGHKCKGTARDSRQERTRRNANKRQAYGAIHTKVKYSDVSGGGRGNDGHSEVSGV